MNEWDDTQNSCSSPEVMLAADSSPDLPMAAAASSSSSSSSPVPVKKGPSGKSSKSSSYYTDGGMDVTDDGRANPSRGGGPAGNGSAAPTTTTTKGPQGRSRKTTPSPPESAKAAPRTAGCAFGRLRRRGHRGAPSTTQLREKHGEGDTGL